MIDYRNVTLARESRGLTQKELSEKIDGLTQGNLSRMERGMLPISRELIERISSYLNYPLSFFEKDGNTNTSTSLFFRKRASMLSKHLSILEGKIKILSRLIDDLLISVSIPNLNIPHVELLPGSTPSEIAYKIRLYLNIPAGPIDNIVSVLEKNGVIVIILNDDIDKFDGVTVFTNKSFPVIFVNGNMSNDRIRYTLGHEMGHLVMHLRSDDMEISDEDKEKQANEFASEFMMPRNDCRIDLMGLKFKDLPTLKFYWKMSKACIIRRARDLKCISEKTYTYYNISLGRDGERKVEKETVSIDSPILLKKMFKAHLEQLGYTPHELSQMLGLSSSDLSVLYDNGEVKIKRHLYIA